MKDKEFNLSDTQEYPKTFGYKYEDVKEFIKELKEKIIRLGTSNRKYCDGRFIIKETLLKEIDKLAGANLIEEDKK